ncbi:MAG: HAD hydrolase family protein, partial [bacterium]|nr:HAD hydrolase family protein [bacterium]
KALGLEETRYLFDEARKFGLHIQAYCEGKVWCETENEEVIFYSRKGQLPYEIHKDVPGELTLPTHKVLLISFEEEKLRDFQKLHASWEFGRVQSVFSSREFLEYSPLGVSKGNAIERFAGLLGFDLADTIAIGDEQNDISMIMKAGLGVCMANGLESIKQIADYVTTADNNEGGVAEVLERFVLGGF